MTSRVGPKGQVVIPKPVRERLGIRPGDEVVVEASGQEARIRRVDTRAGLRGLMSDHGRATSELEAEHRRELDREARRTGR